MVKRYCIEIHTRTWKAPLLEQKNVSGNFFNNSLSNWRQTYLSIRPDLRNRLDHLSSKNSSSRIYTAAGALNLICKEHAAVSSKSHSMLFSVTWFREN